MTTSSEDAASDSRTHHAHANENGNALLVWKRITLGRARFPGEYHRAIENAGLSVSQFAGLALMGLPIEAKSTRVQLVRVRVKDLGFTEPARYRRILIAAARHGLEPCPAEVGPMLRLAYPEQEQNFIDVPLIAMHPMECLGNRVIFGLCHDEGGRHLFVLPADYADTFSLEDEFVFVRPF